MLFWNMTLTFLQKEMGIYVLSPWAKWTFVSASTNRSERNDTAWLPRLGHKGSRESIWLPCSQSTYPWNSATMLWGSPGHTGRPHVPTNSQHQLPDVSETSLQMMIQVPCLRFFDRFQLTPLAVAITTSIDWYNDFPKTFYFPLCLCPSYLLWLLLF